MEGGINLWSYVRNNPINWLDPYGLKIRLPGPENEAQLILKYLSKIVGQDLTRDKSGYVSAACESSEVNNWFNEIIKSGLEFEITFGQCSTGSAACIGMYDNIIDIDPKLQAPGQLYFTYFARGEKWYDLPSVKSWEPEAALAHELFGHGLDRVRRGDYRKNERDALVRENIVRDKLRLPRRY